MEHFSFLPVNEVALKFKSKKEIYDLLTTEWDIYLPPLGDIHYKFIAQIIWGEKLYLKCKEVKDCKVPHFKTLSVGWMLEFAKENTDIEQFLPDFNYQNFPNREWLWNLLNTVLEDRFKEFIRTKQLERTQYIMEKKEMKVRALREFIKIFKDSQSISTQNGRSHFLIKGLGNKKCGNHIKNSKGQLIDAHSEIETLNNNITNLEEKLSKLQDIENENKVHKDKLAKLYDLEMINSDGEPK